jgi:2-phosphosulfolactate phosphatase
MDKHKVEVCFTPAVYHTFHNDEAIVVVVDILRATSAICTAFMNGVRKIIPVATLEEAKAYKEKGFIVAAERDGIVRDFADFGNSPYNFTSDKIHDKEIVYSTTNGTNTIMMAKNSYQVIIGSYLNFSALVNHLNKSQRDIVILCAGWKEKFNLEDTLFAGALAEALLKSGFYESICDSTLASTDLWNVANKNLMAYIDQVAQRNRLKLNGLDDVIEYCHTFDLTNRIPVLVNDYLVTIPI